MQRRLSAGFPIVLVLAALALLFLGKTIFENLFYAWIMAELTKHMGLQEAQVLTAFSSIAVPLCGIILVGIGIAWYVRRELKSSEPATDGAGMTMRELQLRHQEVAAQNSYTEELSRYTQALEAQQRANDPIPNWPINELFSHIDPDLLTRVDDQVDQTWEKIGNQIRDYASVGRLKIWGRPLNSGVDAVLGQRPSLRLIDPSYWETAFFTYAFFDDTAGDAAHTYLKYGHHGTEYTDLQVNRTETSHLWPAVAMPTSPLDMSVGTSIDFYDLVRDRPSIYSLKKRFKIRLENTDQTRTISGIKVAVTSVSPLDGNYRFPWVLSENGSINPGDHALVPLAVYEERREPEKYPDQPAAYDTFEVPAVSDRILLLGIENEHTFQLRCTANNVPAADATIRITVIAGRMRIEKI